MIRVRTLFNLGSGSYLILEITGQKGSKRSQSGAFRDFREKLTLDFFLSERGSHGPQCVCRVWSPGKIWFSRYGVKRGQTGVSKSLRLFF